MTIRPLLVNDFESVVALQRLCYPPPFPDSHLWQDSHLVRHIEVFPGGQVVAVVDGQVVGSATNMILSEENWISRSDWETMVGGHVLANHDPEGTTLFGVDISVHPSFRKRGIGRAMYEARRSLVRHFGLRRYGTATRMPDFAASGIESVSAYLGEVARGDRSDKTVTPILRMGCMVTGYVESFMEDPESGNAAAILEWRPE